MPSDRANSQFIFSLLVVNGKLPSQHCREAGAFQDRSGFDFRAVRPRSSPAASFQVYEGNRELFTGTAATSLSGIAAQFAY